VSIASRPFDGPPRGIRLFVLLEHILRHEHRRHCGWPTRVKRQLRNQFDDFVPCHAILKRTLQMETVLFGAVEGDQGGDGDNTAVALGKAGPLPNIPEQYLLGECNELRRDVADRLPRD
jgi:hypothetical protein